jgi:hypothetical protein
MGETMEELRCLCATGQLGHGIPREAFLRGVDRRPHFIGADMGSTDSGPYYLGAGTGDAQADIIRRDLEMVLLAACEAKVPLIIGSAATGGAAPHLELTLDILYEIAGRHRLSFRLAAIRSDVDKDYLRAKLAAGKVSPCGPVPSLDAAEIDAAAHIVGQMGVEPFTKALESGAEVIIAGRSCDTAIYAAMPWLRGYDKGLAIHMAKIIECASLAAEPGGREAMLATLNGDHFVLESMAPERRCTPYSVAAHSLYEQPDPYEVVEPGGRLDMTETCFETVDERRTRVSGSRWEEAPVYTVKIEGAKSVGHRYFSLGAMRCPIQTGQTDEVIRGVREIVDGLLEGTVAPADYQLQFRAYGVDGAMGDKEPHPPTNPHEVMVVTDVVGRTPEIAHSVCSVARYYLLHYFYDGILATAGNVALPFVPADIYGGEVFEFNLYHLVEVDDPLELFPIEIVEVREGGRRD